MKRINAFSILELVVVMVITSFIMLAGYFAYSSSAMRLHLFQSVSAGSIDLADLNVVMAKDFAESQTASLETSTKLVLAKDPAESIIYQFEENFISRTYLKNIDTFNVQAIKVTGIPLAFDQFYISALSVKIESSSKNVSLDYEKTYSPFFLMNHNNQ